MRRTIARLTVVPALFAVLTACSSGSDSDSQTSGKAVAVMKMVRLSNYSTPIAAISATLTMPYGVTVRTTANDPFQPYSSAVRLLNGAEAGTEFAPTYLFSRYSAATSTSAGKLKFTIMDARGFTAAEEIMIRLDVTKGFFPKASDFALVNYIFSDINGVILPGIIPTITAAIQ